MYLTILLTVLFIIADGMETYDEYYLERVKSDMCNFSIDGICLDTAFLIQATYDNNCNGVIRYDHICSEIYFWKYKFRGGSILTVEIIYYGTKQNSLHLAMKSKV